MLSAWEIPFYIAVLLLCARLIRLRQCRSSVSMIIGAVVLFSLFQLGGHGGWFPELMSDSDFMVGTLCVALIFSTAEAGEAVLESRIVALESRSSEDVIHNSRTLTSNELPASQAEVRREVADRRRGARRTIRVLARVQVGDSRVVVEGIIDNISAKGMRLRLAQALPLSSSIRAETMGDTFYGIVRYCDAAPDYVEYYAGIEFNQHLDWITLEKYSVEFIRPNEIEVPSET